MSDEPQAITEPAPKTPAGPITASPDLQPVSRARTERALETPSPSPSPADEDHALAERLTDLLAAGQRVEARRLLREVRQRLPRQRWTQLLAHLGLDGWTCGHLLNAVEDLPPPAGWCDFSTLARTLNLTMAGLVRQLRLFDLLNEDGITAKAQALGLVAWEEVGGGTYRTLWHPARVREALKVNLPERTK